jgi:Ca2+/Na+ antiporter
MKLSNKEKPVFLLIFWAFAFIIFQKVDLWFNLIMIAFYILMIIIVILRVNYLRINKCVY